MKPSVGALARCALLLAAGSIAACAKTEAVPRLAVVQTSRPPSLDGLLSDPVWQLASTTGAWVETREGGPPAVDASAKLLWDSLHLYVGVEVSDTLLRATDTEHDDQLWKQDCVELMLDPDGRDGSYFEIEVSPRGVVFDTRYDSRRVPKPFGHMGWDSQARVTVKRRGNLDDLEADAGYTVEMAIPWHAFSLNGRTVAPVPGTEWRANLYVMDLTDHTQRAAAWSPVGVGDFHVPERFGILAFEGPPESKQRLESPRAPH